MFATFIENFISGKGFNVDKNLNKTVDSMEIPCFANGKLPNYATSGSAGADLSAIQEVEIEPKEIVLVNTGVSVEIPAGYCGMICPRSGLAFNHGITVHNAPGIIDSDYRGEIKVILINSGRYPYKVTSGQKIAQLVIVPIVRATFVHVEKKTTTERGEGGFGSTGK